MDCSPCSSVESIPNSTERNISYPIDLGIPFTVEFENSFYLNLKDLSKIYKNHHEIFELDAKRVSSNNPIFRYITNSIFHTIYYSFIFYFLAVQHCARCNESSIGYLPFAFARFPYIMANKSFETKQNFKIVFSKVFRNTKFLEPKRWKIHIYWWA